MENEERKRKILLKAVDFLKPSIANDLMNYSVNEYMDTYITRNTFNHNKNEFHFVFHNLHQSKVVIRKNRQWVLAEEAYPTLVADYHED